jgi:hypothetical protein
MSKAKELPKLNWEEEWAKLKAEARRHHIQPPGARSFSDVLERNGIEGIATAFPPVAGFYAVDIWLFVAPYTSQLERAMNEITRSLNAPISFRFHFPNRR